MKLFRGSPTKVLKAKEEAAKARAELAAQSEKLKELQALQEQQEAQRKAAAAELRGGEESG